MNNFYRILLSVAVAIVAVTVMQLLSAKAISFDLLSSAIVFIACAICALISPLLGATTSTATSTTKSTPSSSTKSTTPAAPKTSSRASNAVREQGQVKWFNVSKGYGFVTRRSGEDIFVHFRSIRGDGRRTLIDGQRVEFTVAKGDKGPQAEDVEPL